MYEMLGPTALVVFGLVALVGGTIGHTWRERRRA